MVTLLRWFKESSMKVNPKKFQFMILGKTPRLPIMLNRNQVKVEKSKKVVLLSFTTDNRLTFKDHVDLLCSTASYKLHALRMIKKYLYHSQKKTKPLYNAFINSQFNYAFNNKISFVKVIIYNSCNKVSIDQKHLRALATEIYETLSDINPDLMKPYFKIKKCLIIYEMNMPWN